MFAAGEAATGNWLRDRGSQVVTIYAGPAWQYYRGGTVTAAGCGGTAINHAVQLTGYGTDSAGRLVWRIRNSWGKPASTPVSNLSLSNLHAGTGWGSGGFIVIQRNANACGIGRYGGFAAW